MTVPSWLQQDGIDTVVVAFPDLYGRLLGKRLTRDFFVAHAADEGTHACNYLLTVDLEMNPLPGFQMASWEAGYGDFHCVVDLRTLRHAMWLPQTAFVLCDLCWGDHQPVAEAPRSILKRQLARLTQAGYSGYAASELEFYLFNCSYREAFERGYRPSDLPPSSEYLIDYHLLQPTRDEPLLRRMRNELSASGIPIEGSKGEWGRGQHELNVLYAEVLEMADRHVVLKHAIKEIAAQHGQSVTFMAKWHHEAAGSSSHLHFSLWDAKGGKNVFATDSGQGQSETFAHFLGGLLKYGRELSYCFAPTINAYKRYQAASWAPTSLVWAHDNRTTGFRVVGQGRSLRIENRMPGADTNPYLAFAATIAAGLRGIEERLDPGPAYRGNAYADKALPRLPGTLSEAAKLLQDSALAHEAFGPEVVQYLVHSARLEVEAYDRVVTDWERGRYFERG